MKKTYIAATIKENEKYYSYIIPVSTSENLISKLEQHKNIIFAHICDTKKQARNFVETWNACHKINGKYLFDGAPAF